MKMWTSKEIEEELQKVALLDREGAIMQVILDMAVESDSSNLDEALKEESEGLCTVLFDATPEGLILDLDSFGSPEDILNFLTDYMGSVEYNSDDYWITIQQ